MPIKVLVKSIDSDKIQQILDYYNENKPEEAEPLERLDRCEDGFQIKLSYMKEQMGDINKKIKQVRWNKGYLLSKGYISFKNDEEMLLYESLVYVLGSNNVIYKNNNNTNVLRPFLQAFY
jgi:hypothetical protein